MALTYSRKLCSVFKKNGGKNLFAALKTNFQNVLSVAHYTDEHDPQSSKRTISRAMKVYLEKVVKYDEFLKEQFKEYEKGKEFLASMMGKSSLEITQKDVDEAIDYLFPSALFVPKSRPIMKPPDEVYEKQKEASFDYSGRPYHFLFYTSKPNFYQCLHEAASKLEELDFLFYKKGAPSKPLNLVGGRWLSQEELEAKLLEKLYQVQYDKFIEVFQKLADHPLGMINESFVREFWMIENVVFDMNIPKPTVTEDGIQVVTVEGARKKLARANVKVFHPGSGRIQINNIGIDYFFDLQSREQIIFPLLLTEMLGKVDIEATIEGGGEASQAAAIRLGISKGLQAFVSKKVILQMKVAGLLQPDFRRRERKKPGQEGARRRYTWLKR